MPQTRFVAFGMILACAVHAKSEEIRTPIVKFYFFGALQSSSIPSNRASFTV